MQYIGIDIGTSSVCGVLYDPLTKLTRSITRKNDAALPPSFEGEKIQDPNRLLSLAVSIIDVFLKECPQPAGIGITGQMHGILYYSNQGLAVSPLYTWQDNRGNLPALEEQTTALEGQTTALEGQTTALEEQTTALEEQTTALEGQTTALEGQTTALEGQTTALEEQTTALEGQTTAEYLTKITGHFVASGYGLVTHYYNVNHHLVPPDAVGLCTIMDYIVMKLTGSTRAVIDNSNAASLGFFDTSNNSFDSDALSAIKINPCFLPKLLEKNSPMLAGTALAKRIGSSLVIPIMPAIGDNQAAFIGAVLANSPEEKRKDNLTAAIHITIGTSSQLAVYSPRFITVPFLETRPFPGGGYLLTGAALSGGSSLTILKSFFEKTLQMFLPNITLSENNIYKIMTNADLLNQIASTNALRQLSVETCFSGTRQNPKKRGAIKNITADNFTPNELILGFLEGMVTELYEFRQKLPKDLQQNRYFIAGSGNALRKNNLLCQILESKFNLPLKLSACEEEAALGAAERAASLSDNQNSYKNE